MIRIVDKTVPHSNFREHEALIWVLNHGKTSPADHKDSWSSTDYIGYHPYRVTNLEKALGQYLQKRGIKAQKVHDLTDFVDSAVENRSAPMAKTDKSEGFYREGSLKTEQLTGDFFSKYNGKKTIIGETLTDSRLGNPDILYLADNYGVYVNDYLHHDFSTHLDYSNLIFGGFDVKEVEVIERFINRGGHLIAEFNTFASPTHSLAGKRLEYLLGVNWTRWTGRFFADLGDFNEVPAWAKRNWKKHYNREWAFKGPGWLITHEDTRLFVLQAGRDVLEKGLLITDINSEDSIMNGALSNVPFRYWFDIVTPSENSEVLADYQFHLTESGKELMGNFGVPDKFPAVIRRKKSPLIIYFAGDFSDNDIDRGPYYIQGIADYKKLFRFQERHQDQSAFFWEFYVPIMTNILEKTPRREN